MAVAKLPEERHRHVMISIAPERLARMDAVRGTLTKYAYRSAWLSDLAMRECDRLEKEARCPMGTAPVNGRK